MLTGKKFRPPRKSHVETWKGATASSGYVFIKFREGFNLLLLKFIRCNRQREILAREYLNGFFDELDTYCSNERRFSNINLQADVFRNIKFHKSAFNLIRRKLKFFPRSLERWEFCGVGSQSWLEITHGRIELGKSQFSPINLIIIKDGRRDERFFLFPGRRM